MHGDGCYFCVVYSIHHFFMCKPVTFELLLDVHSEYCIWKKGKRVERSSDGWITMRLHERREGERERERWRRGWVQSENQREAKKKNWKSTRQSTHDVILTLTEQSTRHDIILTLPQQSTRHMTSYWHCLNSRQDMMSYWHRLTQQSTRQEDESPPNKQCSILNDRHWGEPSQSQRKHQSPV